MQIKLKIFLYIVAIFIVVIMIFQYEHNKQKAISRTSNVNKIKHEDIKIDNVKKIETETDKEVDTQVVKTISLGKFKLTAYCPCRECCGKWADNRPDGVIYGAIGEELREGYSIAVDPDVIPYRTEVIINENTYKAQDCGGGIKGSEIDVYFKSHNDALDFGVQYADVFIKL